MDSPPNSLRDKLGKMELIAPLMAQWERIGRCMERLDDIALFVEVIKAHSFRRAAEALKMPSSSLSRRIAALEKTIGLRLIHRTTRKLELTEAGQVYFERCKRIVDEARLAHVQLVEMAEIPGGLIRASLPVDFSTVFLAPLIAQFAHQYPGIRFELDLSPRRADLVSEPLDLAIRMGEQPDSGLIARQIGSFPRYLYAAPRYLKLSGEPAQPADLKQHECLRLGSGVESAIWTLYNADETIDVRISGRFVVNSIGMLKRLTALEMGISIQTPGIVSEEVAAGRLQRVLPEWEAAPLPVYAITETRLLPAKTKRFIEFLSAGLAQHNK